MPDKAIKKRMDRAKQKAIKDLEALGYEIYPSDNRRVCLIAARKNELRFIKICIDTIPEDERRTIRNANLPAICAKEIWLRLQGEEHFEIHKL